VTFPAITGLDLSVLYGGAGGTYGLAGAAGGTNPVDALRQAVSGRDRGIAATAKQPEVQRDIAAFRRAVASASDPKALLADPVARRVLLTANGLGDQADYTALATKALLSDPADPRGLANKLTDARWKSAAATLAFATKGLAVLRDPKVLDTLAGAYAEIAWRKSLDAATPGLSDALTFRATAASAKTVDDVLGNATLRRVTTGALGIPQEFAIQPLDTQERALGSRLDVHRLQDSKYVDSLAQRYLIAKAGEADTGLGEWGQGGAGLLI